MSAHSSPEFDRELLDDFYAECNELSGQIRAQLALLDTAPADVATPLESLYRAIHSFKGNCGIVSLRVAEQLAHAAEDVLRNFTTSRATPPPDALALLARVLDRLEQIVAAQRLGKPLPAIDDLVAPLGRFKAVPTSGAEPRPLAPPALASSAPSLDAAVDASPAGALWQARFAPAARLDQRGVNVSSVRQRLAALGTLVKAEPVVRPDGGIVFNFTVRLDGPPPVDLEVWRADGVDLGPIVADVVEKAPSATSPALSIAPSHIVRVDMSRLDDLMRIMGELVIQRSRLEERIARTTGDRSGLEEVNAGLARSLRDLRAAITRVRMVSVGEIFTRMPFAVRELAHDQGKTVRLDIKGQDTEIDKYLVERLKEPLLHLVRNAVSHGVETPAERVAAGKPAEATLTLRAETSGHSVLLTIEDDGHGVDLVKAGARAKQLGFALSDAPSEDEILSLLCQPGFSTRHEADLGSGRGVGMAVVHTTLRELGGVLALQTAPGRFTRFTLRLPLTLSIADAFIVSTGDQTCAVPRGLVDEIIQFEESAVRTVKQTEVIPYRDGVLPIVRLSRFLDVTARTRVRVPVLVVATERGLAGVVVDRVHAHREVVVRPMSDPLLQIPGIAGATELGDGRPVLILDPAALTRGAVRPRAPLAASTSA